MVGAGPLFHAGRVVHQDESQRTLARVRTDGIAANVGTHVSRLVCALVHVLARCIVLREFVTIATGAPVTARLVHALVLTVVRFILDALVYI